MQGHGAQPQVDVQKVACELPAPHGVDASEVHPGMLVDDLEPPPRYASSCCWLAHDTLAILYEGRQYPMHKPYIGLWHCVICSSVFCTAEGASNTAFDAAPFIACLARHALCVVIHLQCWS